MKTLPQNVQSTGAIEVVRGDFAREPFRAALFDFDGTLSLLRRDWQDVMIPMMIDILLQTGTSEPREQLQTHVEQFVMRLNGRQTIYQMIQLADEVEQRCAGAALDPLDYKQRYHDILGDQVRPRVEAVRCGMVSAEDMSVPESCQFLQSLSDCGVKNYLSSGTDVEYVRSELAVLKLDQFFGSRVFGALDDYKKFSKAMIVQRILAENKISGNQLLGFGDGFVEIEEIKRVGGLAVGVASNEQARKGVNTWKRNRLIDAGADIIIGDYRCREELLELIGLDSTKSCTRNSIEVS